MNDRDKLDAAAFKAEIATLVDQAREEFQGRAFSDTIDAEGHQYIDYVMEGGGVLGVALLGYTYLLEQVGIRFLGIGGTSAGSIAALMLAAADVPALARSDKLIDLVANMPMGDFVDGRAEDDDDAAKFIDLVLRRAGPGRLLFSALQVLDNIDEIMALNRGEVLHAWARKSLDGLGISTVSALQARMTTPPPGISTRDGEAVDIASSRLAVIAADVSTETKAEFPRMAGLYWPRPEQIHPAHFVRASMSIPLFFRPYAVPTLFRDDAHRQMWRDLAGFSEHDIQAGLPSRCLFVDGGVLSNFPIDVFHRAHKVPSRPTFGVKLQWDERCHDIARVSKLVTQTFNSARHCLDYEFIRRNPDYQHLVAFIDTADHDWLNFNLDRAAKLDLFRRGAHAAVQFLRGFDWAGYKALRKALASGYEAARQLRVQARAARAAAG
jgi:NTE family protein